MPDNETVITVFPTLGGILNIKEWSKFERF